MRWCVDVFTLWTIVTGGLLTWVPFVGARCGACAGQGKARSGRVGALREPAQVASTGSRKGGEGESLVKRSWSMSSVIDINQVTYKWSMSSIININQSFIFHRFQIPSTRWCFISFIDYQSFTHLSSFSNINHLLVFSSVKSITNSWLVYYHFQLPTPRWSVIS